VVVLKRVDSSVFVYVLLFDYGVEYLKDNLRFLCYFVSCKILPSFLQLERVGAMEVRGSFATAIIIR
jgi:hypothetical protein